MLLLALTALAAPPLPDLVAYAELVPAEVPVGTAADYSLAMCNEGTRVATNAYLSVLVPNGVGYAIVRQAGSCRAVRYSTGVYLYCMTTVRVGACPTLQLHLTPGAAADYTIAGYVDLNNLTRESDETNNTAPVVLTGY